MEKVVARKNVPTRSKEVFWTNIVFDVSIMVSTSKKLWIKEHYFTLTGKDFVAFVLVVETITEIRKNQIF